RKWCYIRMEGRTFGDVPLNLELKLEVWDSPNSAGVVIDAVRCAKLALDRRIGGPLIGPAAYFMKSPPRRFSEDEAYDLVEEFIAGPPSGRYPADPRPAGRCTPGSRRGPFRRWARRRPGPRSGSHSRGGRGGTCPRTPAARSYTSAATSRTS